MQIEQWPLERLIPYARNPRKNDHAVDEAARIINEFGFRVPILAKSDGEIMDGHLRLKAALKLGMETVPVIPCDDMTDVQIKAFRISVNRMAELADWDLDLLKLELEDLKELDFDLSLTGLEEDTITGLLKSIDENEGLGDADEIPEPPVDPVTKHGDLWLLGRHRLLCGDSRMVPDIERLMNGEKADMVFTDPPYNLSIKTLGGDGDTSIGRLHDEFAMASGEMTSDEFTSFLSAVFVNLISLSKDGSIHYICMDWRHARELLTAGQVYTELKNLCVWNKDNGGMGTFYRSKHELIFVYKNGTAKHINNFELGQHGRYRTNVWDYPMVNSFANTAKNGKAEECEETRLHPTVKPVSLIADAARDCSNSGDIIADLFGGSGSTLIAGERSGRTCYLMELDPKYCDVIVKRWEAYTGKKAVLADGPTV